MCTWNEHALPSVSLIPNNVLTAILLLNKLDYHNLLHELCQRSKTMVSYVLAVIRDNTTNLQKPKDKPSKGNQRILLFHRIPSDLNLTYKSDFILRSFSAFSLLQTAKCGDPDVLFFIYGATIWYMVHHPLSWQCCIWWDDGLYIYRKGPFHFQLACGDLYRMENNCPLPSPGIWWPWWSVRWCFLLLLSKGACYGGMWNGAIYYCLISHGAAHYLIVCGFFIWWLRVDVMMLLSDGTTQFYPGMRRLASYGTLCILLIFTLLHQFTDFIYLLFEIITINTYI